MAILEKEEALNFALLKYKESMPPNIPVRLTYLEWQWLNALASRAFAMTERIKDYSLSWTLLHLFKEGIAWQINVEIPLVRKAGIMLERGLEYQLPEVSEIEAALNDTTSWGDFWETYGPAIYAAISKNDANFVDRYKLIWPPKFIRLPSGWREITTLYIELLEARSAPGPKPNALIALCKEIVMAFPAPVTIKYGEIDLLSTAVGIIVGRLNK